MGGMSRTPLPILAFAPLRWTSLPGPSRRVLAQLARTRSVLVLETPEAIDERDERQFWELSCAESDLIVCRPRVANPSEFANSATTVRMVRALLAWLDIDAFVAWHYAPSALAFVRVLSPSLVIHDRSFDALIPSVRAERAANAAAALAEAEAAGSG